MTNIFRKEYREISDEIKHSIALIKDKAQILHDAITTDLTGSDQRMREIAIINLEQAVMWAVKAIT